MPDTEAVKDYLLSLQGDICRALEEEDEGGSFREEKWSYPQGGGGITRVLSEGGVIEQGGVSFSDITGSRLPDAATSRHPELSGRKFRALGVSVVIHPNNPYVPTSHMNVRFIISGAENAAPAWWFGGGFDLTPCYGFNEDVVHWHKTAFDLCREFGDEVYPRFKKWCDEYFYLKHRAETRGVGGLFFDDLKQWGFDRCFEFMRSAGDGYLRAYRPIVHRRKHMSFGHVERDWQQYRRGRYVEFNLLYDRGTLFGLQSGGRAESVLMSLPPKVSWRYNYRPRDHGAEAELYEHFLGARDWLGLDQKATGN